MEKFDKVLKENWEILVLLFFVGLFLFSNLGAYKMFMWDEAEYASIARTIVTDGKYAANGANQVGRLPLYPLSIAVVFSIFGASYETTKVAGILYALVSIFAVYFFVRMHVDKKTALASAFILASTPLFLTLSLNTLTDVTFLTVFFMSAMFFYMGVRKDPKYFYATAFFFGLSFLTRYNALLFLPIIGIYMGYLWSKNRVKLYALFKSKHLYLSIILFLVIIAPWMIYVQGETGDAFSGILDAQARMSGYAVASFPWYHYFSLSYSVLNVGIFLLFGLGVLYVLFKRKDFGMFCLIFFAVNFLYFSQFTWKEERMMVSWLPFMAIFAGVGLMKIIYPLVKRDFKSKSIAIVVSSLILFSAAYFNYNGHIAPKLSYSTAIGYPSLIDASHYVDSVSPAEQAIVGASVPQYFWYANRITYSYPGDEWKFFDMLNEKKISFVLVNNYERNQPRYILDLYAKGFFDEQGQLKYASDAQRLRIFGDLMHFNDPGRYPVTIVVPADLFKERIRDISNL